jgi:hypothetical protein
MIETRGDVIACVYNVIKSKVIRGYLTYKLLKSPVGPRVPA